jgi:hypothetical protein
MNTPRVRRGGTTISRVFVLLALISVVLHVPADATIYSYVGPEFNRSDWSSIYPGLPATIGDHITFQFTYDAALPVGSEDYYGEELPASTPWSITAGSIVMSSDMPTRHSGIYVNSIDGVTISSWMAYFVTGWSDGSVVEMVQISTGWSEVRQSGEDSVAMWTVNWEEDPRWQVAVAFPPASAGSWTSAQALPVPGPTTVLLLGSGLIPLAWARRKKRLGK